MIAILIITNLITAYLLFCYIQFYKKEALHRQDLITINTDSSAKELRDSIEREIQGTGL